MKKVTLLIYNKPQEKSVLMSIHNRHWASSIYLQESKPNFENKIMIINNNRNQFYNYEF